MALKVWVDRERLIADDLNAAFAWSQQVTMPGAWSRTQGADVSGASGAFVNVPLGAPPTGADPLGLWKSGGTLLVPAGLGGLWLFSAWGTINSATDSSPIRYHLTGMMDGQIVLGGGGDTVGGNGPVSGSCAGPVADGTTVSLQARCQTAACTAANAAGWSFVRLARGIGPVGAVGLGALGLLTGPGAELLPGVPEGLEA